MTERRKADEWIIEDHDMSDGFPVGLTWRDVGQAIATWASCQSDTDIPVAAAAAVFNMTEAGVRKAVEAADNPFFYIIGDQLTADGV